MPALGLWINHRKTGGSRPEPGAWARPGRAGGRAQGPGFERCVHFGGSKAKSDIWMCAFVLVPVCDFSEAVVGRAQPASGRRRRARAESCFVRLLILQVPEPSFRFCHFLLEGVGTDPWGRGRHLARGWARRPQRLVWPSGS